MNSIKGSANNIKNSILFIILAVGGALSLAVRIWQVFNIIEPETGFFSKSSVSITILYALLTATSVLLLVFSYIVPKVPKTTMLKGKHYGLSLASLFVSLTLILNSINRFSDFGKTYVSYDYAQQTFMRYLLSSGALPKLLEGIFAGLSVIFFLCLAIEYSGAKNMNCSKLKFLAVCPMFWQTFRIVQRFTRTISFVNVSDLLLELFMIAFAMMFFMNFAQMCVKINYKGIMNKILGYGLICALFSFVVALPRLVLMIFDKSLIVVSSPLEWCDISISLFIVSYLFAMHKKPMEDNMTQKQIEKLEKERENVV